MKYVKMLGLAAIAAAALMAFVGSSTASAAPILCKTTPVENKCPANQAWAGGTTIHAVNVGTVFLHSTFKTVECKKSTVQGSTEGEEKISGAVEVLTFEECNCEVKVLKKGTQSATRVNGHNGTLTANGQEVTVTCATIFGNVHCIYVTNNKDLGEITAGNPAIFHADATVERSPTNGLCDEESTWTATYEVTSPKPLFFGDST